MLDVCLLGTGGTIPLPRRRLSATLVCVRGSLVLLDCGEGTQVALRERGWGLGHLKAILITHAHADHVLVLPGLLLSLGFTGKGADEPLTVYGPPPLEEVLRGLLVDRFLREYCFMTGVKGTAVPRGLLTELAEDEELRSTHERAGHPRINGGISDVDSGR